MASSSTFCFLFSLMMAFMASSSPLQALSSNQLISTEETPTTISAAPAMLPDSPLSPYTELSPDIAPLLPSPGGVLPTIPSNPSPPNPDQTAFIGPDSAIAPSGAFPASSAKCLSSSGSVKLAMVFAVLVCWLIQAFSF